MRIGSALNPSRVSLIPLFILLVGILTACSGGTSTGLSTTPNDSSSSPPTSGFLTNPVMVGVIAAPLSECAQGGSLILSFTDLNANSIFDEGEPILSSSKVCNGANGVAGYGAGIIISSAPPVSCPAGGSVFSTFVDRNNNAVLDADESINSFTTLCNGVAGQNGESAHLTVSQASAQQCPAGGRVYSSQDASDLSAVQTVVCNGQNGTNGQNGLDAHFQMGAVGSPVANKNYSACHHDYLYIPDSLGGSRGWLTFRHQSNGAADQGIGLTGFQIWNVDIADFMLASEQGGQNYCALHWDPSAKVLTFTVVDGSDGLSGTQGSIAF